MRIAMLTLGSRGDVQPMVVLGSELRRRGHDIVLAVPPNLVDFGVRAGFADSLPLGPDSQAFVESDQGQQWLASGNVRKFLKAMGEAGAEMAPEADRQLLRATEGADLMVCGILGEDHAICVSEAFDIPMISLHLAPLRPNRGYPNLLVTTRDIRWGGFNRMTGVAAEQTLWRILRSDTNTFRDQLGLAPVTTATPGRMAEQGVIEIQGYSRTLVPRLELADHQPFVGFMTPDIDLRDRLDEGSIDPELDAWLDADEPPIYFGFGSMPVLDPEATFAMIRRVSAKLGQRALVSAGWSLMRYENGTSKDVFMTGPLNHELVLPRCRVAVHHGGAGTTAAATMAKIPSFVCSVFADQPFWGRRLEDLGIGGHCRFVSLDEQTLLEGVNLLLAPMAQHRARDIGEQLQAEAGAEVRAADLVERAGAR